MALRLILLLFTVFNDAEVGLLIIKIIANNCQYMFAVSINPQE